MQAGLQFPKLSLGEASFGAAVVPGQPLLGVATGEHQGLFLTRKKGAQPKAAVQISSCGPPSGRG